MNVRLQARHHFRALVHWQNNAFINQYDVTLDITTGCDDHDSQNVAMDRINHMLFHCFSDSIMINSDLTSEIRLYQAAGLKITTLPTDPFDQIIGLMLYSKLNAVCEGRMTVDSVSICSDHGDHIWYLHDHTEAIGPFAKAGWWNEPSCRHWHSTSSPDTVVDLKSKSDWARVDLAWPAENQHSQDGKVVFAKFDRDDD
jgi:hypothetical protein